MTEATTQVAPLPAWKVHRGMRLVVLHAYPALITLEVASNAILAAWAFVADRQGRRALSALFWTVLLVVVALTALQVAAGIMLAVGGARPRVSLHFLYGMLVVIGATTQFGLRPGGFLHQLAEGRQARALALLCFTQSALLFRAYTTGALGR